MLLLKKAAEGDAALVEHQVQARAFAEGAEGQLAAEVQAKNRYRRRYEEAVEASQQDHHQRARAAHSHAQWD